MILHPLARSLSVTLRQATNVCVASIEALFVAGAVVLVDAHSIMTASATDSAAASATVFSAIESAATVPLADLLMNCTLNAAQPQLTVSH